MPELSHLKCAELLSTRTSSQTQFSLCVTFIVLWANSVYADLVFNAAEDFSIASNPNGAWSYGYSTTLTGSLILHATTTDGADIDSWDSPFAFGVPSIYRNTSASVYSDDHATMQPGQLALHPGANNEYEKARLTIPAASEFRIVGSFQGVDFGGPTSTDVHVLLNGVAVFSGNVNGFGPTSARNFDFTVPLAIADRVEFAVGYGSNGNYFRDGTALSATVTAVPEPSSLFFVLIGIPLAAKWRKFKRCEVSPCDN